MPAVLQFSDLFDRADGPLGADWSDISGFSIITNAAQIADGAGGARVVPGTYSSDQAAEGTLVGTAANHERIGVGVRMVAGLDGYFLLEVPQGELELWKIVSGFFTLIAGPVGVTPVAGDVLRIEIEGTAIKGFFNGVQQLSATDSDLTGGKPGMRTFAGSATARRLDNFNAYNIEPPPVPGAPPPPKATLILNAFQWTYDADLNAPPARWSCSYLESGQTGTLSPAETISRTAFGRAAIDVTLDGSTGRLATGVVREHGIDEEGDSVLARASGLDLKADLLDFLPTAPTTYKGMQVLSDSTAPVPAGARKVLTIGSDSAGQDVKAAFFESFQTVAAKVCKAAGFTADFDAYDYDLGEDVVWETNRTANDLLAQLSSPFNATERFKLDIFVDANNMARFIERGRTNPPDATIDYERILSRSVRRFKYPAFNDAQVLGATYLYAEPDVSPIDSISVEPGQPSRDGKPYQISYRYSNSEFEANTAEFSPEVLGDIIVSDVIGTRYYDKDGRETEHSQWTVYYFFVVRNEEDGTWKGTFTKIRDESLTEKSSYTGPHGELTGRSSEQWVQDTTQYKKWDTGASPPAVVNRGKANFNGLKRRETEGFDYDAEGNLAHSLLKTYRAEETDDGTVIKLTGLVIEREVEQFLWYSVGRRWRLTVTRNYGRDGSLTNSSSHAEPESDTSEPRNPSAVLRWVETSRGRIGQWWTRDPSVSYLPYGWFLNQPKQYRPASAQVKSGPDNAQLRFSFGLLGTPDDCTYFRGKIRQERKSTRYEMTLRALPNLSIVEGMDLVVADAPARWERASGFISARSMRHEERLLDMTLTVLDWIDP